jgi:isopenicillin N synthase-like dioxygenase
VGFFYLKNHPIAEDMLQELTYQSRQFFELPLEKKMEADMMLSKHFLGYVQPSREQTAKKIDHRETFTVRLIIPGPCIWLT